VVLTRDVGGVNTLTGSLVQECGGWYLYIYDTLYLLLLLYTVADTRKTTRACLSFRGIICRSHKCQALSPFTRILKKIPTQSTMKTTGWWWIFFHKTDMFFDNHLTFFSFTYDTYNNTTTNPNSCITVVLFRSLVFDQRKPWINIETDEDNLCNGIYDDNSYSMHFISWFIISVVVGSLTTGPWYGDWCTNIMYAIPNRLPHTSLRSRMTTRIIYDSRDGFIVR